MAPLLAVLGYHVHLHCEAVKFTCTVGFNGSKGEFIVRVLLVQRCGHPPPPPHTHTTCPSLQVESMDHEPMEPSHQHGMGGGWLH